MRFRIQDLLVVVAVVALFVGFFAPELRAWNRSTLLFFEGIGIVTIITLASFTPVWVVMIWLRRRFRRGLGPRTIDYLIVLAAYLLALGIILVTGLVIRWLVIR
ncbi:MAG: hypothetical protein NVSMB9_32020 [Isosphaeraceae bacterium]